MELPELTPEQIKARNGRNIAIALGLGVFVLIVFVTTLIHLGGNVAQRPF